MMDDKMGGAGMVCRYGHHKVMPAFVGFFGLAFLLGTFGTVSAGFVAVAWPVLVIIAGL